MAVAAPVIVAEMADWVALGGRNSGIVGDDNHTSGFHRAASEVPATDYSRRRDPNGPDGPYTNWSYACAGDFWHGDDPRLLAYHRRLLARLEAGELPMICEFIGQPDPNGPVLYWSRWGGRSAYRGSGHGTWTHVSWYRSRADQRAYLWQEDDVSIEQSDVDRIAAATASRVWTASYGPTETTSSRLGEARDEARKARLTSEAVLAAVGGADQQAILDRINQVAAEERQRDAELAGLVRAIEVQDPAAIAAAIPPTLAGQVADELARRLGAS